MRADANAERRDWTIESVVPGGDGLAVLADGRIGFATGVAPGDVIRPLSVEAKKGSVRASRWELVEKSPDRAVPACPVADRCGGCDWMHMTRAAQVRHKEQLLRSALNRTGGIRDLPTTIPVIEAGEPFEYRSRTRFHIDPEGRMGFHARGTHTLVEIPECLVSRPEINTVLNTLRGLSRSVWMELCELEIRVSEGAPPTVLLRPRVPGSVSRTTLRALQGVSGARIVMEGEGSDVPDRFELADRAYLAAPAGVFTQVNWPVNRKLVEAVVTLAQELDAKRFCDAYAGAGNFSLPLLAAGLSGVSIEKDERAVAAARVAADTQGLPAGGFIRGTAKDELARLARGSERFDLLVLDPPRAGAADALGAISGLRPSHIAYVACDPVTLARDVRTLAGRGYRLVSVSGFDMFPQTHHLEALAFLSTGAGSS